MSHVSYSLFRLLVPTRRKHHPQQWAARRTEWDGQTGIPDLWFLASVMDEIWPQLRAYLLETGQSVEMEDSELLTYEPFVSDLAEYLQVSLPPWIASKDARDDWQTSAWDDKMPFTRATLLKVMRGD